MILDLLVLHIGRQNGDLLRQRLLLRLKVFGLRPQIAFDLVAERFDLTGDIHADLGGHAADLVLAPFGQPDAETAASRRASGSIDRPTANAALTMLEVDAHGFDEIDRRLLLTIMQKYDGGPVGLGTLAATLAEEEDALEEVYEPFLIQIGFLDRTPRGRVATRLAYEHFGLTMPGRQTPLF